MRTVRFAIAAMMLVCVQSICRGQVSPEIQENMDRYNKLYVEQRWSDALEFLQSLEPKKIPGYHAQLVRLRLIRGEYEEAERLVESNQEEVSDAWCFSCLGWWYLDRSPSKSRQYLTKSLDLEPTQEATEYAIALAYRQNDVKYAAEALRKLYKRHPNQMAGYSVDLGFPIEEADRKFGQEQVDQLCKDRPHLAPLITPRISEWLVRRFSGAFIGKRAVWTALRPDQLNVDVEACHVPPTPTTDCQIWVKAEIDGRSQLACLVFELLNAENSDEFHKLSEKVIGGLIDKDSFVREVAKCEHRAFLKRRAFFTVEYFAGGLAESTSIESAWELHIPTDFDEYYKSQAKLVNEYYEEYYDSLQKVRSGSD